MAIRFLSSSSRGEYPGMIRTYHTAVLKKTKRRRRSLDGSVACLLTLLINFVVELKTQKGLVCAYEMNNLSRFFFILITSTCT